MFQFRFALAAALACGLFGLTSGALAQQSASRDVSIESDIERAQVLFEGGRTDEALALVNGVLDRAAGNAEARFLLGMIYVNTDRRDDAIEVFSALTSDFPELPEPWNNLAVLFAENGEFDKARQALLAAIQTHPSYSTAHENLGDLYARMASMAYDRALEQDRGNESARLKLSAVNGLFSVPSQAPVQVAAAPAPAPVPVQTAPAPAPVEPEPEPEPAPAVVEPITTAAVTRPPVQPEPEPEPVAQAPVQPAPEPSAAAPVPAGNPDDVARSVRTWASAWSEQD
ncbi:MAG: tetratricopeptide repeat protein, partial [Pseudomonadota bacterium]